MKRPVSPLVWLCAVGAIALGVLTVYDPNGVYADYVAALGDNTPPIAAAFTAVQDGVYPWSVVPADDISPRSPAYRPLNETVTDEEMRSSVGNNEPFLEETQPDEQAPVQITPSVEIITPGQVNDPAASSGADDARALDPTAGFVTVDLSWFNDALFIGDSHTEGLCDYGGMRNATYYYKRGLDIWSVMKKQVVDGKMTIPQALAQRQFGKIYIMLGINEIGCGTTESFAAQYADVVSQLRELQPDALIYIQAIFHTSQKKSATSSYNNDTINARNAAISAIADGEHVFFIDCNAVFDDETGALTASYSGDGVHVKAPYYTMWRDYLLRFGRAGVPSAEPAKAAMPAADPAPAVPAAPSVPTPSAQNTPAPAESSVQPSEAAETEQSAEPTPPVVEPVPDESAAPETPAVPEAPAVPEIPSAETAPEAVQPEAAQAEEPSPEAAPEAPEAEAAPDTESAPETEEEKNIESEQNNA